MFDRMVPLWHAEVHIFAQFDYDQGPKSYLQTRVKSQPCRQALIYISTWRTWLDLLDSCASLRRVRLQPSKSVFGRAGGAGSPSEPSVRVLVSCFSLRRAPFPFIAELHVRHEVWWITKITVHQTLDATAIWMHCLTGQGLCGHGCSCWKQGARIHWGVVRWVPLCKVVFTSFI